MEISDIKSRIIKFIELTIPEMEKSEFGITDYSKSIAYYDSRKDNLFESYPEFSSIIEFLSKDSLIQQRFGETESKRLLLQIIYTTVKNISTGLPFLESFEITWLCFREELENEHWQYAAISNIQNIISSEKYIELSDEIVIRERSSKEISELLGWSDTQTEKLLMDFIDSGGSSDVIIAMTKVKKNKDNFLLQNEATIPTILYRIILAMRLDGPGDVRIGKIYFTRPAKFNIGLGGTISSGSSNWNPGPGYLLSKDRTESIRLIYSDLLSFEKQKSKKYSNITFALRSFSSVYDRQFHQAEDRVLDCITALEALWKLDVELSFKLAFRTSSLLATSDDERITIYDLLSKYYKVRSKIVHGGGISDEQKNMIFEIEPLKTIVRRTIRAFIVIALDPSEKWSLNRLYEEADRTLLHSELRNEIQKVMKII